METVSLLVVVAMKMVGSICPENGVDSVAEVGRCVVVVVVMVGMAVVVSGGGGGRGDNGTIEVVGWLR